MNILTKGIISVLCLNLISNFVFSQSTILPEGLIIKKETGKTNSGRFSLAYPMFLKSSGLRNIEKINHQLKKTLVDERLCEKDVDKKNDMYVNTSFKLSLLNKRVLSFSSDYKGYCGGPYPDYGITYYNLDLKTAKWLDLEKTITHKKRFKRFLFHTFQKKVPSNIHPDCRHLYRDKEFDISYFNYLLTSHGLKVRLSYAHVARACEFAISLSCEDIRPYILPSNPFLAYCYQ